MIVNQWVPAAHQGRCDRRHRAPRARTAARHGPPVRHLRADDRRRPRGDVRPFADPAGAAAGDVTIFHFALPSPMTDGVRAAAARTGAAVPQRDAGALLRALRCRHVPAGGARPAGAGDARRTAPTWRSATRSTTGRSSRRWASPTPASSPSPSTSIASAARHGGPRSSTCSTTGCSTSCSSAASSPTRRSRITSGWPSTTSATSTTDYRFIFVGKTDGVPRYYDMVRALLAEFQMPADRFIFTGAGAGRGSGGLLPDGARLHLALRARRLLRAAARGDGRRRAGARLCVDRRARHAGRRRRAVRARRISSSPRSCSASSPTTTALRARVIAGQRRRLDDFGDAIRHALAS